MGAGTVGDRKVLNSDITPPTQPGIDSTGALTSLARLAVESGGEYTERTNDLTGGLARAGGNLSCVYSLGFYDDHPDEERIRDVTVRVRATGVTVAHAAKLIHRTPAAKRESQIRGKFMNDLSAANRLHARAYPLRPVSEEAWEGVIAIRFDLPAALSRDETLERDFGGVLHSGSKVTHEFDRHVTLRRPAAGVERHVTFMEPVNLRPGQQTLSVVLSDPVSHIDQQVSVDVAVPEVPKDRLFVVGPILGRRAGNDLVLRSGGSDAGRDDVGGWSAFQPLLTGRTEGPEDLFALTQICMVRSKKRRSEAEDGSPSKVHRVLETTDRGVLGQLPGVPLALEGDGPIRCQNLLDLLPLSSLEAGEYAFRAFITPVVGDDEVAAEATFRIEAPID